MKAIRRRKCCYCKELFYPDSRNVRHQRYCGKAECRKASKRASQQRWLSKPENREYFRGPENVERVQRWRAEHPGYWQKRTPRSAGTLQDISKTQPSGTVEEKAALALQDVFLSQDVVLIGLIAQLTGSTLQDEIASSARHLLRLGHDIVSRKGSSSGNDKADFMPGAFAQGS